MCRMLPLEGNTALCIEQDFAIIKATLSQNVAPQLHLRTITYVC